MNKQSYTQFGPPGDFSRYSILEKEQNDGRSETFLVHDRHLGRRARMKLSLVPVHEIWSDGDVWQGSEGKAKDVARLVREARVTSQLAHRGIAPVYDIGVTPDDRVYFTMEWIRGTTLKTLLQPVPGGTRDSTLADRLALLVSVCDTMAHAHGKGVLHRDLKPANVLIDDLGNVYVTDWSFLRVASSEERGAWACDREGDLELELVLQESLEEEGMVVGTPVYMSPEQASGRHAALGPGSDVYSMGAILYQLLTGTMPYVPPRADASAHAILMALINGPPRPVHEIAPRAPNELVAICEKAMAREPSDRLPGMRDLREELLAYLDGGVVRSYDANAFAIARGWIVRNMRAARRSSRRRPSRLFIR